MGKYKAVRKKVDAPPQLRPGVPCLVILGIVILVIVVIMFLVIKNA
jgi:hypothetical protein